MSLITTITAILDAESNKKQDVEFVYQKDNEKADWRKISLIREDSHFVIGIDSKDNRYKKFNKQFIVGQRIMKVKN